MTLPNPNIGPCTNWTFENAQLWYPRNGVCSTLGIPFYETIWMGKSQASAILVAIIHVEPSLINEEDCFWMFNGRTRAGECTPAPNPSNEANGPPKTMTNAKFLKVVQSHTARVGTSPSTVRGRGSKGTF